MTRTDDLIELLNREQILLSRDFHPRVVGLAVSSGGAVRVLPGVLATLESAEDLTISWAAATLLTGGVVGGLSAAVHHDLADGLPDALELIVPYEINRNFGDYPVSLWRTQRPDVLTVGVETAETPSGAKFRVTSAARTIVDLYRVRNEGHRQHARDALISFLQSGQDQEELAKIAMHFRVWSRIQPHLELLSELQNKGMTP